jgi:Na+/melibiose symporter-like transporter
MYLAHIPINHHLRGLYRVVAGLSGLYLVALGIYGIIETSGLELFAQEELPEVWRQQLNPASAGMVLVLGGIVVIVTALGRNLDHFGNFWIGQILIVVTLLSMAVERTDANVLGFNMTSIIVIMTVGVFILTASMYAKVGRSEQRHDPSDVQHPNPRVHA